MAPTSPPATWGTDAGLSLLSGSTQSGWGDVRKQECPGTTPSPNPLLWAYVLIRGGCIVTTPCSLMSGTQASFSPPGSFMGIVPLWPVRAYPWPPLNPRRAVTSMWFAQVPCLVLRKPPFLKGLPAFCCLFCSLTPFPGLFSNLLTLAP